MCVCVRACEQALLDLYQSLGVPQTETGPFLPQLVHQAAQLVRQAAQLVHQAAQAHAQPFPSVLAQIIPIEEAQCLLGVTPTMKQQLCTRTPLKLTFGSFDSVRSVRDTLFLSTAMRAAKPSTLAWLLSVVCSSSLLTLGLCCRYNRGSSTTQHVAQTGHHNAACSVCSRAKLLPVLGLCRAQRQHGTAKCTALAPFNLLCVIHGAAASSYCCSCASQTRGTVMRKVDHVQFCTWCKN